MKTIVIILFVMLLAGCKEEPGTIKSSDIKDEEITNPISSRSLLKNGGIPVPEGTIIVSGSDTTEQTWTDERNYVKQDIFRFSSGKYCMNTWVYVDGSPIRVLTVAEDDGIQQRIVDTWFVKSINSEVKKAQWNRAQKILDEHLNKIKPYK